jgi:hypothetical protein
MRRSNLAFAKVEIGLSTKDVKELGARMKRALKATSRTDKAVEIAPKQQKQKKPAAKPTAAEAAPKAQANTASQKKPDEAKKV